VKTSVIEVHALLSVLSVDDVEKRIGEVPGVESVTVNYAAGSATVRYDETRLAVAEIKSAVRQRGYESAAPAAASARDGHDADSAPGAPPETPAPASRETAPAPAVAPAPTPAASKPTADAAAAAPAPDAAAPAGKGHAAPDGPPAKVAEIAHEMGHGGKDLPAMVRDMRNRFWICLIFSVPIFVYSPMGLFTPPAPPFDLEAC
jgi:P-type Cu2+ transporter